MYTQNSSSQSCSGWQQMLLRSSKCNASLVKQTYRMLVFYKESKLTSSGSALQKSPEIWEKQRFLKVKLVKITANRLKIIIKQSV